MILFGWVDGRLDAFRENTILDKNVWKIRKINSSSSSQATSCELGEYNLPSSILTLRFTNCVKFNFGKSYLPTGFPYKHCNF